MDVDILRYHVLTLANPKMNPNGTFSASVKGKPGLPIILEGILQPERMAPSDFHCDWCKRGIFF